MKNCSSTIDGEVGARNIADHFAGIYIYQALQSESYGGSITSIKNRLDMRIKSQDRVEVVRCKA